MNHREKKKKLILLLLNGDNEHFFFFYAVFFGVVRSFSVFHCFASSSNTSDKKNRLTKKNKTESKRTRMLTFNESTFFFSIQFIITFSFNNCCYIIFKFLASSGQMSITNRAPPPTAMQTRFGFIPRPTAPGLQQNGTTTVTSRSRSISPTSTASANSSSSSLASQRLAKAQATSKQTPNRSVPSSSTTPNNTSKSKPLVSPRQRDSSVTKLNSKSTLQTPTASSRMRSRTPSRTSAASPSSTVTSPPPPSVLPSTSSSSHATATIKTDVNAIRDRYKTQKRMNFFTRHTPISTANGSPIACSIKSPEPVVTDKEKKPPSSKFPSTNNPVKIKIKVSSKINNLYFL
jgi:hypothetical protein